MGGYPAGRAASLSQPINYLLFRVYEAARQLKGAHGIRNVVIVIDEICWYRFDMQLRQNWIDWARPQFINSDDMWNQFLSLQQRRYPELRYELADTIREIDSLLIFQQNYAFEFRLQIELHPNSLGQKR
jgi:hypothetical protein